MVDTWSRNKERLVLCEDMVDTWSRNKESYGKTWWTRGQREESYGKTWWTRGQREESYVKTWWTRCHVTKRGVLWEDMVDTWSRKERSPMGRHGGHVDT